MKIGNISQSVLKRSVLKEIHINREEMIFAPAVEEMCAGIRIDREESDAVIMSSAVVFGDEKDLGYYGIAKAVNDIASRKAEPVGVEVVIQLPPYAYESRLKAMVSNMEACCQKNHLQILGVKASVNPMIQSAMVYVSALGTARESQVIQTCKAEPDYDVVLLGSVGTEGALRILNQRKESLEDRFIPSFFTGIQKCKDQIMAVEAIKKAIDLGAIAIHQLGDSGILAGLWELGESSSIGLEVDLKQMTIRQDVIEICEFVGLNPYQLSSTGSALIVTNQGNEIVEALSALGYNSNIIGKTTSQNERVIFNGDEKRFLDRPAQGELLKLYSEEKI
ncbi:MAG: AIR synthase related protein [Eubacteriales bacterium]